jgi:hypothetical protein
MVWVVTQRDSFDSVANNATTAATPIKAADGPIENVVLYGFHISVDASDGAGHTATVKVYGELAATHLYHESLIDFSSDTQALVMLTTAGTRRAAVVPIFSTPFFTITDASGGAVRDYTILFFVKALE